MVGVGGGGERVILGTAGHIDHGKTTLVHRLTGVDTDRLPEEKRRGITIELGFAPLDLGDLGTVGPGVGRSDNQMVKGSVFFRNVVARVVWLGKRRLWPQQRG